MMKHGTHKSGFLALVITFTFLLSACGNTNNELEEVASLDLPTAPATQTPTQGLLPAQPLPGENGLLPAPLPGSMGGENSTLPPATLSTPSADVSVGVNTAGQTQYDWQGITVTRETETGKPIIIISPDYSPDTETTQRTLLPAEGETPLVSNTSDLLVIKYEALRARDSKNISSSWETEKTSTLSLDNAASGWTTALMGMRVGERRLITIPGEFTLGKPGSGLPKVRKGETLIAVVDLIASIETSPRPERPTPTPSPTNINPTPTSQNPTPDPAPSPAFTPLPLKLMGLQISVPTILEGNTNTWPNVTFNSIRVWDPQTTWAALEPQKGAYQWQVLDDVIAQAKVNGVNNITFVVGGTPEWAIQAPAPASAPWIGANSASPPANQQDWIDFLTALSTRYVGQINAYQLFNAPNDPSYFSGTPAELATLVKVGSRTIKRNDGNAKIIAPGFTFDNTRKPKTGERWWKALNKEKWPVDVVSYQLVSTPVAGVEGFTKSSQAIIGLIRETGWEEDIWVTEMTYVERSGKAPIAQKQRELVARTYWAVRDLGIKTAYWYTWGLPSGPTNGWWYLLLQNDTAGGLGYADGYQAGR